MAQKKVQDRRMNLLSRATMKAEKFEKEITEDTNVNELSAQEKERLIYLEDAQLVDDPYNSSIYGDYEIDELAESMKQYGFSGVILAYPWQGKYRIESGHRRREAARKAGILKYPVLVTEAPKEDWERRLRLFKGNLHGRKYTPMVMARTAQGLYESHAAEIQYKKENNLLQKGEITALNQLTAMDLEVTVKSIEKYKQLLKLNSRLQVFADMEGISWSALTMAAALNDKYQNQLADTLDQELQIKGIDTISSAWITTQCKQLRKEQDKELGSGVMSTNVKTRNRRKDGGKVITKCSAELHEVLDQPALYKKEDIPQILDDLKKLQESISRKINELESV